MYPEEVSPERFEELFGRGTTIYDSTKFAALNSGKVLSVRHVVLSDTKPRFGIILGDDGLTLSSPFSAPFGGMSAAPATRHTNPELITSAIAALKEYGCCSGRNIRITLPPPFYSSGLIAEQANALFRLGKQEGMEINHHFPIEKYADYVALLPDSSARYSYRRAHKTPWQYQWGKALEQSELFERAYRIIRLNREANDYPLRMSAEEMLLTAPLVGTYCLVQSVDGIDVAAAIVYTDVAEGIWHVIYWGDSSAHRDLRPMNALAPELYRHAKNAGVKIVDIGPSSQHSVPNFGLCRFKLSVGCEETLKMTFSL